MDFALNSAGFTAMRLFQLKGRQRGIAGVYPWTMEQFVELASFSGATWVAQPDMCCEPEVAADQAAIDFRINATATLLEGMLRVVYAWQDELSKTMSAREVQNAVRIPVPDVQGWSIDDYRRSIDLMMQVWERWMPWIAPPVLIGLGSVCRRHLTDPRHGLFAILEGLEGHVPAGGGVHLFGVKGPALARVKMYPWVGGVDSMAAGYSARVKARQAGVSNTIDRPSCNGNESLDGGRLTARCTCNRRPVPSWLQPLNATSVLSAQLARSLKPRAFFLFGLGLP
ncbi:DUF7221 family queuine tRNA-ribosyltransferase-like protein [Paraburkholderia youngii]|uniref:deazapurine DNA modification protein DpdA family protein n=1 Tax=Paraburkholderia youngii TaxID=2782701 RepID=UPI003D235C83